MCGVLIPPFFHSPQFCKSRINPINCVNSKYSPSLRSTPCLLLVYPSISTNVSRHHKILRYDLRRQFTSCVCCITSPYSMIKPPYLTGENPFDVMWWALLYGSFTWLKWCEIRPRAALSSLQEKIEHAIVLRNISSASCSWICPCKFSFLLSLWEGKKNKKYWRRSVCLWIL